jgi:hypothetical protein
VAGIVRVVAVVPDADARNPAHPLYDAAASDADPVWWSVRCVAVRALARYVTLHDIRAAAAVTSSKPAGDGADSSDGEGAGGTGLRDMVLLRQPRLSTQPVTQAQWDAVVALEGAEPSAAPPKRPAGKSRGRGGRRASGKRADSDGSDGSGAAGGGSDDDEGGEGGGASEAPARRPAVGDKRRRSAADTAAADG